VPPNFAGSERAKKIVRLAEVPLANRWLKKPGMAFSTDCYVTILVGMLPTVSRRAKITSTFQVHERHKGP
jgi:hypothetical protein